MRRTSPSRCGRSGPPRGGRRTVAGLSAAALLCGLSLGCAGPNFQAARTNFYLGRFDAAEAALTARQAPERDRCLALMELGMVQQAAGRHDQSTRTWLDAVTLARQLDYYSVSRGAASLTVNEALQTYTGMPFERTLLHAFAAKSYLMSRRWDGAAVEARNLVGRMERLDGFPDDAYSRYVAAFCLELTGDGENAALEYRNVSALLTGLRIDDRTGRIVPADAAGAQPPPPAADRAELVCFVLMGRAPAFGTRASGLPFVAPHADFYAGGQYLGRSHVLTDIGALRAATDAQLATLRTAKTVARIAAKETAARLVEERNPALGELIRLLLFAAETPDARRWETLPRWLGVARMPCPPTLGAVDAVFRGPGAMTGAIVRLPLVRHRNTFVALCRDLAPAAPTGSGAAPPATTAPAPQAAP